MPLEDVEDRFQTQRKSTAQRSGYAAFEAGMKKRDLDLRTSYERNSPSELVTRAEVVAVAKRSWVEFYIDIANNVVGYGGKPMHAPVKLTVADIKKRASPSEVSIVSQESEQERKDYIDQIKKDRHPSGGGGEPVVDGVPAGLGTYVQAYKKLDGKPAAAVGSFNACKGVEFGVGLKVGCPKVN